MIYVSVFITLILMFFVVVLSALLFGIVRDEWRENKWLALCYILFWFFGIFFIASFTASFWLDVI